MPILSLLVSNWKSVVAVIITAALALGAHKLDVYRIEESHRAALEEQKRALTEQCDKDKKLTAEVSNGYQISITALNRKLADAKRLRTSAATCVSITGQASGRDASAGGTFDARQNAIAAESLIDYAGAAEKYRLQLVACQSFINETWKAKGQ